MIGVKTIDGDEEPRAYVVRRDKQSLTAEDVMSFVRERVAKQKQLCGGVVFVDNIPKTAAGKILRRELRERGAQERRAELISRSSKL